MKKLLLTLMGFVIGVVAVGSVSAYAKTYVENVYWNKDVTILFNGLKRILPMDYVVMNYKDYNYTSARFIAEGLGAQVSYDEQANSVFIDTVPPKVIYEVSEKTQTFIEAPTTFENNYIEVDVHGVEIGRYPQFSFSVVNTKGNVEFLFDQAYMEYDGEKYGINEDYRNEMENVRFAQPENLNVFYFEKITATDSDEVTVTIPTTVRDTGDDIKVDMVFKLKLTPVEPRA